MSDIFEKFQHLPGEIGQYNKQVHGYFTFPKLIGEISNRMVFNGKEMIVWSLNNYLGLANHPEVRQTDAEASAKYGLGLPMGARMMSGNSDYHEQLEKELAEFEQKQDAFLLNFGYQGIFSIVDAVCSRHDIIVYDAECHACIIDGIRLHVGSRYKFKHNDISDCEKQIQRALDHLEQNKQNGGILVISEGVFGMGGDQGKIKEIVALKQKYSFRLLVDDAHGFGTIGKQGRGVGEEQDCQDGIDLYFSTFAKSMASIGAFVAGEKDIIDYLRYNLRSQTYAKSLPMPLVLGNLKRLELIKKCPELREKLWQNCSKLQKGLVSHNFNIGNTNSPVTPVYFNAQNFEGVHMAFELREFYHIFCSIVVYPVIPKGQMIYRLIPTAVHNDEDIEKTLDAFDKLKGKLFSGDYDNKPIPQVALN